MAEKILIADDDAETLRLVGLMLQRQGYQIVPAHNGLEAINLAQTELPDLIVMDVMMPELDGYAAIVKLRSTASTADIPILIFTAKNHVDDKVAGYESGADDYITKPVHPAELVAHVKALLNRKRQRLPLESNANGYVVGMLSPKGGMGVSSLALSLAIAVHQKSQKEVIAAELRPGQGSWAVNLNLANKDGLTKLLRQHQSSLSQADVESQLLRISYGIRLLLASTLIADTELACATPQFISVIDHLKSLAPFVVLDIGTPGFPGFEKVINQCNELMVITEGQPESLRRTELLIEQLKKFQIDNNKQLSVVVINRQRADFQFAVDQIHESLGIEPVTVIPPAPELAYQSAVRCTPIALIQPDGIVARQIGRLTDHCIQRIKA